MCTPQLERSFPGRPLRIVAGFSRDKDLGACLRLITGNAAFRHLHLVRASHPRAAITSELVGNVPPQFQDDVSVESSVGSGVHAALGAANEDEILVICGSVFIMSAAREALGFHEPKVRLLL